MSALRLVPVLTGGGTRLPVHVGVLAALQELGASYQRLVGRVGRQHRRGPARRGLDAGAHARAGP